VAEDPDRPDDDEAAADPEAELDGSRMTFMDHLRELRTRIRNSALALVVCFFIAYTFKGEILYFLARPLTVALQSRAQDPDLVAQSLYYRDLLEPFWAFVSLSLWGAVFLASPYIFYQLWQFIAPGLYKRERRMGVLFALSSAVCFVGGAMFCYFVVLPVCYNFLLGYATDNIADIDHAFGIKYSFEHDLSLKYEQTMRTYIDLTRNLMLGFGVIFELPVLIGVLSALGMVTHRSLWKFNRWWIILSFFIGAVLTPPDVLSQVMMAIPMVVLYNLSIFISWLITRRREAREGGPPPA